MAEAAGTPMVLPTEVNLEDAVREIKEIYGGIRRKKRPDSKAVVRMGELLLLCRERLKIKNQGFGLWVKANLPISYAQVTFYLRKFNQHNIRGWPRPGWGERYYRCVDYADCLKKAALALWASFDCRGCPKHQVDGSYPLV
jgi:hypothetical protein